MIFATAGHVDHGKTSLVRALTGVETDRLEEERRRGLTIEPGFAYVDIGDERWGFVDVPGHHRFVANMLTGAAGVDAALLVVAADDGIMPQTLEHLSILSLLGVERMVVAISKADLVEPERLEHVDASLAETLEALGFEDAPRVPVSAPRGDGIDALRAALGDIAATRSTRDEAAVPRFAVDRAFSVKGAGLVVTGFIHSGSIHVGDTLELLPRGLEVRVRGLRAQDQEAELGRAGERLALNLAGATASDVDRGSWCVRPGAVPVVHRFDARLHCLPDVTLKSGSEVFVHCGTARSLGRVTLLDGPMDAPRVHVSLREPTALLHGDRFVLRDASAAHTLAGGRILDHRPPPRGRTRPERLAELDALELPSNQAVLARLHAQHPLAMDGARWARLLGLPPEDVVAALPDALTDRSTDGGLILRDRTRFEELVDALCSALERFHSGNPQLAGMGPDELRAVISPRPTQAVLKAALARALQDGRIERTATRFRSRGHRSALKGEDAQRWARVRPKLAETPMQPPVVHDLARTLGDAPGDLQALLIRVHHTGEVVRVADNRFLIPEGLAALAHIAEACAGEAEGGRFEARMFKQRAGIGRNLAIDVLEYFDRNGLTRRQQDCRIIVGSAEALYGPEPTLSDEGRDA